VYRWVGEEPTAAEPGTFSLLPPGGGSHGGASDDAHASAEPTATPAHLLTQPDETPGDAGLPQPDAGAAAHKKPFNAFLDSGGLALAAQLGRAHYPPAHRLYHDTGSRFSHMMARLSALAGGWRIGFNNAVFLAQKQHRLKTLALSYFLKGAGVYPSSTDAMDAAHTLFQAEAVAVDTATLGVMAATLAASGVCPFTAQRVLAGSTVRAALSQMYSSGLSSASGGWSFTVGLPACGGASGMTMVIVPGLAGIAIHAPALNERGVSVRAARFAEALVRHFRLSLMDRAAAAAGLVDAARAAAGAVAPADDAGSGGSGAPSPTTSADTLRYFSMVEDPPAAGQDEAEAAVGFAPQAAGASPVATVAPATPAATGTPGGAGRTAHGSGRSVRPMRSD
jgi:glutaminase